MSYHFIFVIIAFILESNDDKDMGKKGTLTLLVVIGKLVWPLWKTIWSFLKKLTIELLCGPAISHPGT